MAQPNIDPLHLFAGFNPFDPAHREGIDPRHGVGSITNIDESYKNVVPFKKKMSKTYADFALEDALALIENSLSDLQHYDDKFEDILTELRIKFRRSSGRNIFWRDFAGKNDNPVGFIKRIYSAELARGMSQSDLKKIDPDLYAAFHNYCHKNGVDTGTILPRSKPGPRAKPDDGSEFRKPTREEQETVEGQRRLRAYNAERQRISRAKRQ